MTRSRLLERFSLLLCVALFLQIGVAHASIASDATAEAFGLSAYDSSGAVLIVESAPATASLSGGATSDTKDLVYAGAGSLVESATLHTEAQAAAESSLTASLQQKLSTNTASSPSAWNVRGFATTSQLRALKDALGNHLLTADAIDAEAVVACDGANVVYGTAARMSNLKLAGQTLDGVIADRPNQTYEAAGVKLIFWETSFDQATNTVSVNGLHVIVPGALGTPDTHIIVSHSEATATCPQPTAPGPLDHFEISPISDQVAGGSFSVTVTAYDAAGKVKTDYSGTPVLTSDLSASTEGCGATNADPCTPQLSLGTFTDGVATATVTAYKAEPSRALMFSDGTITASSNLFSVAPAATDHLEVSGPTTATTGVAATFTVRAHDLYGNTSAYTGTVHVTSSDATAALPPDYTFVTADAGTRDIAVTFETAGEHTVSVTDTVQPAIAGAGDPVVVTQQAQGPSAPTITSLPTSDPGNDRTVSWSFSGEAGASYECVLERPGAPALTDPNCSSPVSYDLDSAVDGSGDGAYTFKVRQTTASGTSTFASESYTLDTTAPTVTLASPAPDAETGSTPSFSGTAGEAPGDGSGVTVVIYGGKDATGSPVQILTALAVGGSFEVTGAALSPGTYTAQAAQTDDARNTGVSSPVIFTVVSETGSEQPSPAPTPTPSPSPVQEPPQPSPDPTPEPSPAPTPTPSPNPVQEPPQPSPGPTPEPSPDPDPVAPTCDLPRATICGTDGPDDVTDTAGDDVILTGAGNDKITITGGNDVVRSGPGNDLITVADGTVVIYAGAGNDIIRCAGGGDRVFAGRGSDLVVCRGGDDTIAGGPGDDELHGNRGSDRIRGGFGNDLLFGGPGPDYLRGGADDDTLRGGRGADLVRGGSGDDLLFGGPGPDYLRGGAGDDTLRGGRGEDALRGMSGNDVLFGGPGRDSLRGGSLPARRILHTANPSGNAGGVI